MESFHIVINADEDHRYKRHARYSDAVEEAERLAKKERGKRFLVFSPVEGRKTEVPMITWKYTTNECPEPLF